MQQVYLDLLRFHNTAPLVEVQADFDMKENDLDNVGLINNMLDFTPESGVRTLGFNRSRGILLDVGLEPDDVAFNGKLFINATDDLIYKEEAGTSHVIADKAYVDSAAGLSFVKDTVLAMDDDPIR